VTVRVGVCEAQLTELSRRRRLRIHAVDLGRIVDVEGSVKRLIFNGFTASVPLVHVAEAAPRRYLGVSPVVANAVNPASLHGTYEPHPSARSFFSTAGSFF